jgi:hypothetical protein
MPLETGEDYYNYYSSMMPWGNQGTGTTAPGTGITQLATPRIKYPPQYGGGGGEDFKGGGIWGNLDLSKTKNFTKDVWSGEIGGPANMYEKDHKLVISKELLPKEFPKKEFGQLLLGKRNNKK